MKLWRDYDNCLVVTENGFSAVLHDGLWYACDWFNDGDRQELHNFWHQPEDALKQASEVFT